MAQITFYFRVPKVEFIKEYEYRNTSDIFLNCFQKYVYRFTMSIIMYSRTNLITPSPTSSINSNIFLFQRGKWLNYYFDNNWSLMHSHCSRPSARCFVYIISFNLHSNPVKWYHYYPTWQMRKLKLRRLKFLNVDLESRLYQPWIHTLWYRIIIQSTCHSLLTVTTNILTSLDLSWVNFLFPGFSIYGKSKVSEVASKVGFQSQGFGNRLNRVWNKSRWESTREFYSDRRD